MSAVMTTMSGSSSAIAASTLPATNDCDSFAIPARSQLFPPGTGATSTPSSSATRSISVSAAAASSGSR